MENQVEITFKSDAYCFRSELATALRCRLDWIQENWRDDDTTKKAVGLLEDLLSQLREQCLATPFR